VSVRPHVSSPKLSNGSDEDYYKTLHSKSVSLYFGTDSPSQHEDRNGTVFVFPKPVRF